jgi:hypothetical protein
VRNRRKDLKVVRVFTQSILRVFPTIFGREVVGIAAGRRSHKACAAFVGAASRREWAIAAVVQSSLLLFLPFLRTILASPNQSWR